MDCSAGDRLDILELTLQHSKDALGVREVCALLCVDQATAAATAQHFSAQLTVQFSPCSLQQAEHFAQWLVKHADLVNFLDFKPCLPWDPTLDEGPPPSLRGLHDDRHSNDISCLNDAEEKKRGAALRDDTLEDNAAAGSLLARGLSAAAAAGRMSHLNTLHCCSWEATGPPLLQALPTSLTALQLIWNPLTSDWLDMMPWRVLDKAVARLTGLQSLKLGLCRVGKYDMWVPSPGMFSSLTRLTELELPGFRCTTGMIPKLPPSLQRLMLDVLCQQELGEDGDDTAHCAHLTALTELRTGSDWFEGDVLPPNLVRLYDEVEDFSLLLGMKGLQHLDGSFSADELCQLANTATGLTHVNLQHNCADSNVPSHYVESSGEYTFDGGLCSAVDALSKAGVADAVCDVDLMVFGEAGCFGPPLLQPLARLKNLNSLAIGGLNLRYPAVCELSSLRTISRLDLWSCWMTVNVLRKLPRKLDRLPLLHWLCLPRNVEELFAGRPLAFRAFFDTLALLPELRHLVMATLSDPHDQAYVEFALAAMSDVLEEVHWLDGGEGVEMDSSQSYSTGSDSD